MGGGGGGGWYNWEFSVIPLPTRARAGKVWPIQATTRALAWLSIDNIIKSLNKKEIERHSLRRDSYQ